MARAGDVLIGPKGGQQRLTFLHTGEETSGEVLALEVSYPPEGEFPPEHYHPEQEERFTVTAGALTVRAWGRERTYVAGEAFTVPRGLAHTMRNGGTVETRVHWETRPALGTAQFHETLYGLARDGKTNARGAPDLLQLAVIVRAYRREFALTKPPRAVQALLFGALAPLGRALGYRARYAHYSGEGAGPGASRESGPLPEAPPSSEMR